MRKHGYLAIVLSVTIAIAATGCQTGKSTDGKPADSGASQPAGTAQASGAASEGSNLSQPGQFPIVKEPVTLSVLVHGDPLVKDFATNAFTRYYEQLTHVKIEWEIAAPEAGDEALNLRLTGGDVPDIVMHMGITKEQEMLYGSQGIFLNLNDMLDRNGFYFKQILAEHPEYRTAITTPEGGIFSFPQFSKCYHCTLPIKMWVNKKFLDAVHLPVPATTEEFRRMLQAFKERDPNGNHEADEIPLTGFAGTGNHPYFFLMNAFVYYPDRYGYYLQDGKIMSSFDQEGWRAGLSYLNMLYTEDLLSGESFTQDAQQIEQLVENPDTALVGAFSGLWFGVASAFGEAHSRWKDYATPIPPLKGPGGLQISPSFPYTAKTGWAVITNAAANPEVAFRWLDGFYNDDVRLRARGEEGKDWVVAKEGMKGIDGRQARWEPLTKYGEPTDTHWYDANPGNNTADFENSWAVGDHPEENLDVILYKATLDHYEPYRASVDMVIPNLYVPEKQGAELADMKKTIRNYVEQMIVRFVTGDLKLNDSEWNKYLATLKEMKYERVKEIYQELYDKVRQ